MYLPRLRRIDTVIKEMKQADCNTVVSRFFLTKLLKEGKITKNQFTQKIEDIGIKGFKEQLSDEEIKNIDKKYETAYNLIYSGCVLDGVGVMASVGISSAIVSDIYKDNKKEGEKEI